MEPILKVENLTKAFPGVLALDNVSLEFYPGEIHALVGENGAGKSTLIKTLTGVHKPDKGRILFEGKEIKEFTPIAVRNLGIGVIYQELSLVNQLSVAENIFLGHAPHKGPLIDRSEMRQRAKKILEEMGIQISPDALVRDLSIGYQQMVELAKAVVENHRVLIMDEPTASLSNSEVEILFTLIGEMQKRGVTILYISHRLEEIFRISDRVTVFRDGKFIATKNIQETNREELIQLMVGRSIRQVYPKREAPTNTEFILETSHLTGNGVQDISLKLRKGEILGLGGLVGAGRTEFAELLFGVKRSEAGEIMFRGQSIKIGNPNQAMNMGIVLVPEDRKGQGLILAHSISENIPLAILRRLSRLGILNKKKEKKVVEDFRESLRIKCYGVKQRVQNLSGGNQQKVVVAKGLATEPEIIIFDEPTRGIDIGAKQEIYQLMNQLTMQGKAILMITSEMEELLGMSDRIAVFCEGHLTAVLGAEEANAESVLHYASKTGDEVEI